MRRDAESDGCPEGERRKRRVTVSSNDSERGRHRQHGQKRQGKMRGEESRIE